LSKQENIKKYYKRQSIFYDVTRPIFLFGRNEIVNLISNEKPKGNLLEIGCGTGYLLKKLSKLSDLELTGIDLSLDMLNKAKEKNLDNVRFIESNMMDFDTEEKFDIILLSYVFTLDLRSVTNQLNKIKRLLKPDGSLFIVDFHRYGSKLYKKYMNWHGIEMGSELIEMLENEFNTKNKIIRKSYGGLWEYFMYEGINVKD
jgi:S-adenosylmethionine-diacylgycerolhomoserine-N-methlytransferase